MLAPAQNKGRLRLAKGFSGAVLGLILGRRCMVRGSIWPLLSKPTAENFKLSWLPYLALLKWTLAIPGWFGNGVFQSAMSCSRSHVEHTAPGALKALATSEIHVRRLLTRTGY